MGFFFFIGVFIKEHLLIMKKIHITEAQLENLKKALNEINLNGDENLNTSSGNVTDATKKTIQSAKDDGLNVDNSATQVSFTHDALKQNGVTESYTKRQIKEAKLKKLRENCEVFKKSDIK